MMPKKRWTEELAVSKNMEERALQNFIPIQITMPTFDLAPVEPEETGASTQRIRSDSKSAGEQESGKNNAARKTDGESGRIAVKVMSSRLSVQPELYHEPEAPPSPPSPPNEPSDIVGSTNGRTTPQNSSNEAGHKPNFKKKFVQDWENSVSVHMLDTDS